MQVVIKRMSGEELHRFECPSETIRIEEKEEVITPINNHATIIVSDDCLFLGINVLTKEKIEEKMVDVEKSRLFNISGCKIQVSSIGVIKEKEEVKIPWYCRLYNKIMCH